MPKFSKPVSALPLDRMFRAGQLARRLDESSVDGRGDPCVVVGVDATARLIAVCPLLDGADVVWLDAREVRRIDVPEWRSLLEAIAHQSGL